MHPASPSQDYLLRQEERLKSIRETLEELRLNEGRITLEIGSGHGHYLTGYAAHQPTKTCVGIDIMLDRHLRSEKKRTRAKLPNLHFLRAAAEDFVLAMPGNLLLEDVFILFPDPWPKRRHHKNRVIQPRFLSELAATAIPGARLCFRTDHEGYFAAALATVTEHVDWRIETKEPWPFELPTVFQNRAPNFQSFIAHRAKQV